jgi:hypothetical protein
LTVAPELVTTEIKPVACDEVKVTVPAVAAVVLYAVACGNIVASVVFKPLIARTPFWSAERISENDAAIICAPTKQT